MSDVTVYLDGAPLLLADLANNSLLRALRNAGCTRLQGACEQGECGSCLILIDGVAQNACLVPVSICEGVSVQTVASLLKPELAQAFMKHGAVQCGFCTPGFVIAAEEALEESHSLTEESLRERLAGNICRCTGYQGIVDAILEVNRLRRDIGQ